MLGSPVFLCHNNPLNAGGIRPFSLKADNNEEAGGVPGNSDAEIWRLAGLGAPDRGHLVLSGSGVGGLIAWETQVSREIAIDQARDLAHSMNEMTLAGLTGMMITGTVGQRDVFLDQIRELTAVRDLRVIRGEAVSKLYGPGAGEKAKPHDDIERAVLATGKAHIEIENTPQLGEHLRVVYPTLASRNYLGKNCITCHQVPENTPLGAVSMRISLEKTNAAVTAFRDKSILFALIVSLPLMAVVYLFVRRFVTRPLQAMSDGLEELAKGEGDLTRRLAVAGRDEIGATAERFNRMLATIAELVRRVGQSATDVTRSARRLADDAARVADGSQQQKAQSGAAAGTVEILAGHIGEIAGSAEEVCRRAEESLARAEEGQRSLGHLRDHVAEVEKAVEIMAEAENDFMKSTSEITAVRVVCSVETASAAVVKWLSINWARSANEARIPVTPSQNSPNG